MAGYSDEEKQKTAYLGFSALNDAIHTTNVQLMTAAEVAFLKAEASLRGWSGAGDARSNYEQGINLSFNQHGAEGVTTYLADNTSRPKDYEDPLNSGNSIAAMSDITIAWNESSTNEEKLERIEDSRFSNKQMPLVVSKGLENEEIRLDELHDDLTMAKHHLQKEILGLIDKLEEVSEHGREDKCPCTPATKNNAWNKNNF